MNKVVKNLITFDKYLKYFLTKKILNILQGGLFIFANSILIKNKITSKGVGNYFYCGKSKIYNSYIDINGNNNKILIEDDVFINRMDLRIWGNNNTIRIGKNTTFNTNCKIKVYESTDLTIGTNCMFSYNIDIRTSDGHPIYTDKKNRINSADNIYIGNNVWIGSDVHILKGSNISNGSIVGTKSLVNKEINEENVLLVGIPVRIIKRDINWERKF
jgi:acetyltransferase-like isoleucine patch superfamily enzyme